MAERVEQLAEAFVERRLPKTEWTHEAHLRVGVWHVRTHGAETALQLLRERIRRYNESVGTANTDSAGYHETLTRFYVHLIASYIATAAPGASLDALADGLVRAHGARDLPLRYYSRDRLFSIDARRDWVAPDLQPLPGAAPWTDLLQAFGNIDIYLFDQLLRGNVSRGQRVLDAGCGGGRNLVYLLQAGFEVWAADPSGEAVAAVRRLAAGLGRPFADGRLRQEPIEAMTFDAGAFDLVIASAVLHFARDHAHFAAMVDGLWRVLAPGGLLFARLASDRGFEDRLQPLGGGRAVLPDGSERYVVSERQLVETTRRLGGTLDDPLKTTVVQEQRAMTTWVVRKRAG